MPYLGNQWSQLQDVEHLPAGSKINDLRKDTGFLGDCPEISMLKHEVERNSFVCKDKHILFTLDLAAFVLLQPAKKSGPIQTQMLQALKHPLSCFYGIPSDVP